MNKVVIELVDEQIEAIVLQDLQSLLDMVKGDKERTDRGVGLLHSEDIAALPKDIEALERVIRIYTVQGEGYE